jgi:hypothetical protein
MPYIVFFFKHIRHIRKGKILNNLNLIFPYMPYMVNLFFKHIRHIRSYKKRETLVGKLFQKSP